MKVDFGNTSADYGRFRAGFPAEIFARLERAGIGLAGQRILDLGTGTGSMARGLSRHDAVVCGLDAALTQLREARRIDREADIRTRYAVGRAERLPFAGASFDVVSAGQCWRWFDAPVVLAEVRRVLAEGGRLVIATFDWLPLPGSVSAATEELIRAHNPVWNLHGGDGLHEEWLPDLVAAGFRRAEGFFFDTAVPYTHEAWRGRIRASAGIGASLNPARVRAFDAEHAEMLARLFPMEPLSVPHRTFAVIA
jgi:SAM-dependent methyltransferase